MKNDYEGRCNKGYVKTTKGQVKKHYTQMTKEEIKYLAKRLKSIKTNRIVLSKHYRKNGIKFDIQMIRNILKYKNLEDYIIEYNVNPNGDKRCLMRDNKSYEVEFDGCIKRANLCFVISIISGEIVTIYWNIKGDGHDTIDYARYDEHLKIIK